MAGAELFDEFKHVSRASALAIFQIKEFIMVIVMFQICLALIGMELFANLGRSVPSEAAPNNEFNFDTFIGSFNMINIIYTANGYEWAIFDARQTRTVPNGIWQEFGYWFVIWYFFVCFMLQCWLLGELMTGIFLDVYAFYMENFVDKPRLTRMRKAIQRNLLRGADIVSKDKYRVRYWFPKISSRELEGIEQLLTIC